VKATRPARRGSSALDVSIPYYFATESEAVDERGDVACAESVINVDYADVRGTGVHHPEQSGEALEGSAITYAGRNGDHWDADQTANYAGQRAFHSRADYDHTRFRERSAMRQQAVDARDADVIDMLNVIAHQFRGDDCFLGDRDVAGSGGYDHDHAFAVPLAITFEHDGARQRPIFGQAHSGGDGSILFLGGSSCQHIAAMGCEAGEDVSYLSRRFSLGKNHFGHTLAQGTMVVDLGETEILKGQVTEALDGVVRREVFFSNLLEQLAKGLGIHSDVIVDWAGWVEARSAKSTTGDTEEHRATHTGETDHQATL
jgi:hypothetical protein